MPEVKLVTNHLMDLVASLPATKLDKIFQNAFVCEAIHDSLPPLAKIYVLHLLFKDIPQPENSLENTVPNANGVSKHHHKEAIDSLTQLRVLTETFDWGKEASCYILNQTFQANIRKQVMNQGEKRPREASLRYPNPEELDAYAAEQWEWFLLNFVKGTISTNVRPSLMKIIQGGERDRFQFLMMDENEQLWYIIRKYIFISEENQGLDSSDLISFLLEIGFSEPGKAYSVSRLSDLQKTIIRDLADLGLVKLQKGTMKNKKEIWYYFPTKLATSNLSGKQGFLLTEANFRVYAYSTSKLHVEILGVFAVVEYRLPNLIAGIITRESLHRAFRNGITAEQIVCFLKQNVHPEVAQRVPSVPDNVTEFIRVGESYLNRADSDDNFAGKSQLRFAL